MRFRDFTEVVCHIIRSNVFYDNDDFYTISPGAGMHCGYIVDNFSAKYDHILRQW